MLRSIRSPTVRAAVAASVVCAALTTCTGPARAGVTSPQPVSPTGFHVQQNAVATGGGRIAVVMLGYRSLQARTGSARGLGPLQRLDTGGGLPQVAVGADGTVVAAWVAHPQGSTAVLRAAMARPGHSFGRVQELSHARSMALGGVAVSASGRAVVAWRRGTSATPVQAAVASSGHAFGTAQTLGASRQNVPAVAVAPNGTVLVTWLDTPAPPQPPPAPAPAGGPARVLAATLIEGAGRFGRPAELGTKADWSFGPEAAGGPGGAAVTWRQAATEVRLVSLTPRNVFAPPVLLPPYQHRRDGDADLGDHLALGLPAGGSNVALWREVRSNGFIPISAVVKSSSRPSGGVFSPAKQLSASGWLAGTPQAGALTDRTVAAWGESGPGRPRVRIAVRPVGHGWTALRPLPAPGLDTNRLRAATSPRDAVITWIRDVDDQGAGRLYLTTYQP